MEWLWGSESGLVKLTPEGLGLAGKSLQYKRPEKVTLNPSGLPGYVNIQLISHKKGNFQILFEGDRGFDLYLNIGDDPA